MPRRPEYLSEFREREGTREARSLHKALHAVQTRGVRNMSREELKQIGLPLIRETRKRIRLLEEAGLTDSPAYKYITSKGIPTTSGKNLNSIKASVKLAFDFLHTKTSLVQGAIEFNEKLDYLLGADTTAEQRDIIWTVVGRFEESHTGRFINFNYNETIRKISKAAKLAEYDVDEATRIFTEYLENEGELADLEIGGETELDERGRSGWMKRGGSSMRGF